MTLSNGYRSVTVTTPLRYQKGRVRLLHHAYRAISYVYHCIRVTLWEGFGVEEATWEPFSAFVLSEGRLNSVLVDYLSQNNLGELLRLAETLASKTKARD